MNLTLEELYHPVRDALEGTRQLVDDLWREAMAVVDGDAAAPPKIGGKLLRPALCLLSASALGERDLNRFVPLAGAMELLHIAALTHDDVVDKAGLRRGGLSLNALWDNRTAVLSGDYIVARAVELLAELGSCNLMSHIFTAVRRMTEGELEVFGRDPLQATEEDCLRLADRKTATLFAATCVGPTFLASNGAATHENALHRYGTSLGVAFQIIDDVLDIAQPASVLGKPSCGDIVEGKRTLPILYMRQQLDHAERKRLDDMTGRAIDDADRAWAVDVLNRTGARQRAENVARTQVAKIPEILSELPDGPAKASMLAIAEFVLVRES